MSVRSHMARWSAALAGVLCVASGGVAHAAVFTSTPYKGKVFTSGAGPFRWTFESSEPGEYAGVAYRLSTERAWHRCLRGPYTASLGSLTAGTYTIEISDDLSSSWISERGPLNNGLAESCHYGGPEREISRDTFSVRSSTGASAPNESNAPAHGQPSPSGAYTPSRCARGQTYARIGGKADCLHVGALCAQRRQHQYARYHYVCVKQGRTHRLRRRR